jgi:transglutaminase-like putative cysteine protease
MRGFTLLGAQQWAGTLTALFAFLACAVSGELNPGLVALFPLALVGSLLVGQRYYGKLDSLWTTLIIAAFLGYAAMVVAGLLDVVLAAASFVELLCVHRLWHRKTQRDEWLLLLLSLLLLCAGAALSAELLFGFCFLAFSVTATWAMALTHLRFEVEPLAPALLRSKRVATPQLLGGLAALSTLALVGSAVIFVVFPRVTIGGLHRQSHKQPMAGLSDHVDLSLHGTISDDPRVVLRVRLDPDPGVDRLPMHWRARGLSVWTGQGWRASTSERLPPASRDRLGRGRRLTADVEAVAGFSDGVIVTPEGLPISVDFKRPLTARGIQQRIFRNAAGDYLYAPTDVEDMHYAVTALRDDFDASALRGRGQSYPGWVAEDLALPANLDPRVAALARKIAGDRDPADAAAAIEGWLSSNLQYSRDLAGAQRDPIGHFLFQRRQGHCELFSSAMVLMLRTLGIPARNVTGYFGGQRTAGGYYAVRAGDAHSWVEAYFPGAGYARFDPTPPSDRGSVQDGAWAKLVLLWDTLQQRWSTLVVDFDLISQGQAVRRLGQVFSDVSKRLSGKSGQAPWLRDVMLLVGALLLSIVVAARLRRRTVAGAPLRASMRLQPDERRAREAWRKARARMERAGVAAPDSATPREMARASGSAAAEELAAACTAARWGGAPFPGRRARALLRQLDTELRK